MARKRFGERTRARSQAMQLLFQAEMCGRRVVDVLAGPYALAEEDPLEEADAEDVAPAVLDEYAEELALGADGVRDQLDAIIRHRSTNWKIERMPPVDRNLLRLAIYEMLARDEVAVAVSIDESVELAKAYGGDESSRFVNGLLGRVADDIDVGTDLMDVAGRWLAEEAEEAPAKDLAGDGAEPGAPSEEDAPVWQDGAGLESEHDAPADGTGEQADGAVASDAGPEVG